MATIVLRSVKGSPLSISEMDSNFSNLNNKLSEFVSVKDFGAVGDGVADDTAAIQSGLDTADDTVSGAQGNTLYVPQGTYLLASTRTLPNRVHVVGVNKRGSVIKASSGFTGSYMFNAVNGTSSMFDNKLANLTLDCNDIAGLGGVLSDAWQEGGGALSVLINKFRTYGIRFQNGYGGAAMCHVTDAEIFGSTVAAATAGIRVDQISAIGAFLLRVSNTTIAGAPSFPIPRGIDVVKDSLHCQNVHFEDCTSGIYVDGVGHHVLIGVTGGPGVTNVVEVASTFTGSLTMIGCHRAGASVLLKDNRTGGLGTIASEDPGFIRIDPLPNRQALGVLAAGNFDGTLTNPPTTACFGVASIVRSIAGDYTVTLSNSLQSGLHGVYLATSNLAGGRTTVDLIGVNSFRIRTYNASGTLADSNEVKFIGVRVA